VKSHSSFSSAPLSLSNRGHRLRPTEYLFNAYSIPLADCLALRASRPSVYRLAAPSSFNALRDIEFPQAIAKCIRVVLLVRAERSAFLASEPASHCDCGIALSVPIVSVTSTSAARPFLLSMSAFPIYTGFNSAPSDF